MSPQNEVEPHERSTKSSFKRCKDDRHRQGTAYVYSDSKRGSLSLSPSSTCFQSHTNFSLTSISQRVSATNNTASSNSSSYGSGVEVNEAPPSSTPDLLSPTITSSASSPDVPLTQQAFNKRLHALLQAILDQQYDEQQLSMNGSVSPDACDDESEWIAISQNSYDSIRTQRCIAHTAARDAYSDEDKTISDPASANALDVWTASPSAALYYEAKCEDTPLTLQNKRKHDDSYDSSDASGWDGDTTDVEDEDSHVLRKKAKLRRDSLNSIHSAFSYQANETASSRKLRSLTSASSSFTSTVSALRSPSPCFSHPIIHPPAEPPQVPRSTREVAEARLKMLLKREASCRVQDGLPAGPFGLTDFSSDVNEKLFGIDPEFRQEVVQWILDVLPPPYLESEDLYQHLMCSEETRFHAMHLFSRCFTRMGDCGRQRGKETSWMKRARRELTWHVALCCLAISSKFHHDFLRPLHPIYSRQFLVISPELLSHDQFEELQREILDAFNYEIYDVTPHSFFEELWDALPSLQKDLKSRRARRIIRNEMWESLQLAALQCDIMRFPVSLLTAAALVEAVIMAFVDDYEQKEDTSSQISNSADIPRETNNLSKAREDAKPISQDIARLLGASDAELRACRNWISPSARV